MKNWCPDLDSNGMASKYQEKLRENLEGQDATDIGNVNKVMYEAATSPGVRAECPDNSKPWHSGEYKSLIQERLL